MNRMSRNSLLSFILICFIFPMIFAILGSIITIDSYQKIFGGEYEQVEAVIHDIVCQKDEVGEEKCETYIKYFVDGQEYKDIFYPMFGVSDEIGDVKTVYYNKMDPSSITIKSMIYFGIAMVCFAFLVLLFFFFKLKNIIKKEKTRRELLKNGKQVYVDVVKIIVDDTIIYNEYDEYDTFIAECVYTDEEGNIHKMCSEPTVEELREYFEEQNKILKLKAYIDKDDVNKYVIPIDCLFD